MTRTGLASLAALLLAGAASASVTAAEVTRSEAGLTVSWTAAPGEAVDVTLITRAGETLVSPGETDGSHTLSAAQAASRPLVKLTTKDGKTFMTAERVIPLEGGRNFRDLGGYRAGDARVRWGMAFRSGTMTNLTAADFATLDGLGIAVVCDLRATDEREREPTHWTARNPGIAYLTRDYDSAGSPGLRALFENGVPSADQVRAAMTELYTEIAYTHAESFKAMFAELASGRAPLAFNCAAGKDRTGVAAALLLLMLGVDRETVIEDYALSDKIVDYERVLGQRNHTGDPGPWDFLAQLPAEVRAPLLASDPAYIESALAGIAAREGSVDAYFANVLDLSPEEVAAIRVLLLEPAG